MRRHRGRARTKAREHDDALDVVERESDAE